MTEPAKPAKATPSKKKVKKLRKIDIHVRRNLEAILRGSVLVIDPSSGSGESAAGYVEMESGVIVDSGTLEIPQTKKVHERLRYIRTCLLEEFSEKKYDLLVMEGLSIFQFKRMRSGSTLIEAVGVFLACIESREVMYVSPASWHAYVRRKLRDEPYNKTDENDARMMAELVVEMAETMDKEK